MLLQRLAAAHGTTQLQFRSSSSKLVPAQILKQSGQPVQLTRLGSGAVEDARLLAHACSVGSNMHAHPCLATGLMSTV